MGTIPKASGGQSWSGIGQVWITFWSFVSLRQELRSSQVYVRGEGYRAVRNSIPVYVGGRAGDRQSSYGRGRASGRVSPALKPKLTVQTVCPSTHSTQLFDIFIPPPQVCASLSRSTGLGTDIVCAIVHLLQRLVTFDKTLFEARDKVGPYLWIGDVSQVLKELAVHFSRRRERRVHGAMGRSCVCC